jgi:cyclopropane fatty-acyl-phospholipid synthase-like methyltransferase
VTYDPASYWRERGETYAAKFDAPAYEEQERALAAVLAELDYATVLEVGCGFGRIARLLHGQYTGIDLSPTMLASNPADLRTAALIETSLEDYRPDGRFDLVIAVEVLMHVPPADLPKAIRKLDRLSSRYIVTVDWTTPLPRKKTAAHNFLHDYSALEQGPFGRTRGVTRIPVGLQTIHLVDKS